MADPDIPEPDAVDGAPHPRHAALLVGQDRSEAAFLSAWASGRLHHGWLISGPRGVGKATLAWRIARALLAAPAGTTSKTLDVPADHPVARRMAALSEPRLFLLRRPWQAKERKLATVITADAARALKGFLNHSEADGGRRVVIVDAAEEMNPAAANAVLKTLEEPPAGVTFLLVSHRPGALLPTIRSRCRTLACQALSPGDMRAALEAAGADPGVDATRLAELTAGSVGEALRLAGTGGPAAYAAIVAAIGSAPGMDRGRIARLSANTAGAAGAARYDTVLRLIDVALMRLARQGAGVPPLAEAAAGEAAVLGRLAPDRYAGEVWAALQQRLATRLRHARAVNLDPSAVILDTMLAMDEAARTLTAARRA